jgi:hypothetical protein
VLFERRDKYWVTVGSVKIIRFDNQRDLVLKLHWLRRILRNPVLMLSPTAEVLVPSFVLESIEKQ